MQRRWLCKGCEREWVSIVTMAWEPDSGCPMPGCGSMRIESVEYSPDFPGSDIPRGVYQGFIPETKVVESPQPFLFRLFQWF